MKRIFRPDPCVRIALTLFFWILTKTEQIAPCAYTLSSISMQQRLVFGQWTLGDLWRVFVMQATAAVIVLCYQTWPWDLFASAERVGILVLFATTPVFVRYNWAFAALVLVHVLAAGFVYVEAPGFDLIHYKPLAQASTWLAMIDVRAFDVVALLDVVIIALIAFFDYLVATTCKSRISTPTAETAAPTAPSASKSAARGGRERSDTVSIEARPKMRAATTPCTRLVQLLKIAEQLCAAIVFIVVGMRDFDEWITEFRSYPVGSVTSLLPQFDTAYGIATFIAMYTTGALVVVVAQRTQLIKHWWDYLIVLAAAALDLSTTGSVLAIWMVMRETRVTCLWTDQVHPNSE